MNKQLSILVPVYKVEKYIRPFFESIFRQNIPDDCYEIIVVNDGTPDRSMEVVADLLELHDNTMVINQENQGLSVARNTALECAKGEYVLILDSDDLLVDGSLLLLLDKALTTKADLVVADFVNKSDDELETFEPIQNDIIWEEKTGRKLFMENLSPYACYVWRTLYRRQFLNENHIRFVPGIYVQDIPFTHECYLKANKCVRTNLLLTIYREWGEQSTCKFNMKRIESISIAMGKTWNLRKTVKLSILEDKKLQTNIFTTFCMLLNSTVKNIQGFQNCIRAIDYTSQYAPSLRFTVNKRQKMISLLYSISPRLLMTLWYIKKRRK
ncbi:MAG: glycosyltransferase [Bacteroidaceae bacterium]|jgi:glycosyltransferase involved in cell wall biosynthesis|nr:glycosyltransferase [Bacteroidaceae bacterium]